MIVKKFQQGQEGILANYNYTDIAEGVGVVVLNGFNARSSGALTYNLSTQTFNSVDIETNMTTNGSLDFDLTTFNLPKVAKGTAIVRLGAVVYGASGYAKVDLKRVSNAVETIMGTGSIAVASNATVAYMILKIPLTQTNFKKGDNLRMTVSCAGLAQAMWLGHDPSDRAGANVTSQTKLQVLMPFRIDI